MSHSPKPRRRHRIAALTALSLAAVTFAATGAQSLAQAAPGSGPSAGSSADADQGGNAYGKWRQAKSPEARADILIQDPNAEAEVLDTLTGPRIATDSANLRAIANKYGLDVADVRDRMQQLAPIVKGLKPGRPGVANRNGMSITKVAKAKPDECFREIGEPGPRPTPNANGQCKAGYQPRTNHNYPFGATRSGDYVYFGTWSSPMGGSGPILGGVDPFQNKNFVYEGARGLNADSLGASWGDYRPPMAYRINADTGKTEDLTPSAAEAPALQRTVGLRGQGALDDVVLLGGPMINPDTGGLSGLGMFAFEGSTGKFLGEKVFPEYVNMRHGVEIQGDLYFGVRMSGGHTGAGGAVIKWTGSKADPFKFEIVAQGLESEPSYITEHNDTIVTSGWTSSTPAMAVGNGAAIYQSPKIPKGGLTAKTNDPSNWKTIFTMDEYEPDPVISRAMQFGDIASFKGKLMISTYMMPSYTTLNAFSYYGKPESEIERLSWFLNADRATSVMSLSNVGKKNQKVDLLYGDYKSPVFDESSRTWNLEVNNLGQRPKMGPSGFGNPYNYYSWQWTKFQGKLYLGTMDGSTLMNDWIDAATGTKQLNLSPLTIDLLRPVLSGIHHTLRGGDVYTMNTPKSRAVPFDLHGFGNRLSHGVRGWVPFEDKGKLFAGSATFVNLLTTGPNAGGWEFNSIQGRR
ncbi:hypothetical protein [Nocardioides sp. GXZ039]|uniref:hypothetical protein n=1 Tax=Nocardioides sp. GXZ039 TaxID=3136018 RepID=UPI0030F44F84